MNKISKLLMPLVFSMSIFSYGANAALEGGSVMPNTDLTSILERVSQKEVPNYVSISPRMQSLVTIATLSALGDEDLLSLNIKKALDTDVSPLEIREAIYQGMAYVGLSYITKAEKVFLKVCAENKISLPLSSSTTVTDADRFDKGLAAQIGIFGDRILTMHQNAKTDEKHLMVDLLTGFCFGDTYTRESLSLVEREYLTFVYISAMGGCEPQVRSHVSGNISVGNTRSMLIDALTVMVPYIGFPKTLNALAMVNEVVPN